MTKLFRASLLLAALLAPLPTAAQQNIVVFVVDGLRAAAVSPERAPDFHEGARHRRQFRQQPLALVDHHHRE